MILSTSMMLPAKAALVPVVREHLVSVLMHMGVRGEDIFRAEVVVTEACSNVVRHAYDTPGNHFQIELTLDLDMVTLCILDTGKGFDSRTIPVPEPGQIGGYGVHFIRSNADTIHYGNRDPAGTRLTAEINIQYETESARAAAEEMNSKAERPATPCI